MLRATKSRDVPARWYFFGDFFQTPSFVYDIIVRTNQLSQCVPFQCVLVQASKIDKNSSPAKVLQNHQQKMAGNSKTRFDSTISTWQI